VEATEKIGSERILRGGPHPQLERGRGVRTVDEPPLPRRVAPSAVSVGSNLRSFLVALLFAGLVLVVCGALGLLIATSFYGLGGI
jgi:hypothetical protein